MLLVLLLIGKPLHGADGDFRARTNHWAFQFPAAAPAVPAVTNAWVRNDLDRFILQKLRSNGLAPSSEANRVTLIRRLTFNLHGLPPQPAEVEEFLKDTRPDAHERLVDRLLASPRYGERWARHWLDLVHYGESHGYDKDKPRANAWPYRDYLIRAFNRDIPYSRFVQEQIAGDVLFPDEPDGVVATGFIAAGPWDFVGHVELPESKRDGLIARYNDRDDMVMTTMSTFQSLTVHCARCHDHKFDPIATRDYYNLQAVFAGVDRADRWTDVDKATFARRKSLLLDKKQAEARSKQLDEVVAKVSSPEIEGLDARLKETKTALAALPKNDKESPSNGYHSGVESKPDVTKWVQVDLVQNFDLEEIRLIPARPTDFPDTPGFGFPKRFRVEIADEDQFKQPRVIGDYTGADVPNPGDKAFVIPAKKYRGRFVRVTATRLWERTSDYVFALAELQIIAGTNNVAQWSVASALDSIEAGRWGKAKLVDAYDSRKRIGTEPEKPEVAAQRAELNERVAQVTRERKALVEDGVPVAVREELAALNSRLAATTNQLASLPKAQMVYAAANDFSPSGNFSPAKTPRAVHLLKRGDVKTPGEVSQPGSVDFLPGLAGQFKLPEGAPEGARRASLAQWITDRGNLLTRRSIVNRVWQYHFGRGLVDSPNDFGHMGSAPSHPELLDWLAFWFQAHGESLKDLHRLILTSATYRQRSDPDPGADPAVVAKAAGMDSDNRYLWRMNRTRLDAESFRDALLSLSGKLDLTMGGPSVQQFFFKDDHSPVYDYTRFDVDSPGANRRSIYRFIVRSVPDPLMDCLDSADPALLTARRNSTLTALQALASLNNPFVLRQCEHLAGRVSKLAPTKAGQIGELYQLALHRPPTAEETITVGAYAEKHGLPNACRLVINSNEFMFVD